MRLLYISVFGMLGVLSRYYAGEGASRILPPAFPYATFLVNISGAFLIGVIHVLGVERGTFTPDLRAGIIVGFLGGFTTFSSYSIEAFRLFEDGEAWTASIYLLSSPALGLAAAGGGVMMARSLLGSSP